jgi:plastocyanin
MLGVFLLASCQEEVPSPPKREVTPLDLASVGAISGEVRFEGSVPAKTELRLGGWPECTVQHEGRIYARDVLVSEGRVQNALVYLKEGLGDRVFAIPDRPVVVDQEGCLFEPRVAAAQAYQPLRFLNSDPLAHNVHGRPRRSREWNFSLGVKGAARTIAIPAPEVPVEIVCDIHPWMKAYIGVFDHPYFAVTGADGAFVLNNVPPGKYTVEAWHERFGARTQEVSLGAKERVEIVFTFTNREGGGPSP